ncbi:MAG: hypothetical protein E7277_03995 [Lachnospiraceae bacterium]|jgi:O-acetyl-ADP-ribose deacetylase (regulator of RNase III)|nr:hypothetical protein [Lachnospiraceae bacterium]
MIFTELQEDLFHLPKDYYLAQCISSDFAFMSNTSKAFERNYGTRSELKKRAIAGTITAGTYPSIIQTDREPGDGQIFNLVTKEHYYGTTSYEALQQCLSLMKERVINQRIEKLAMPQIGCDQDQLEWLKVSTLILKTFADVKNLEILVCLP